MIAIQNDIFHLYNDSISLVLCVLPDENGHRELLMPYFGSRIERPESVVQPELWMPVASFDTHRQLVPFALPTDGRGDFRPSMLRVKESSGQIASELFYADYEILKGKRALEGMPSTYVEEADEADTLMLRLADSRTGMEARLSFTVYRDLPVITESVVYANQGEKALILEQAGSSAVTLIGSYDMVHLHGAWAKERQVERIPAAHAVRSIGSVRGASGHEHNPFVALCDSDTTEFHGRCYGVSFVYSGDFEIAVDENAYRSTRVVTGINPRHFSWTLDSGSTFQTPETVLVYSEDGFNGMSQVYHTLYRTRMCRGEWRDRERPILINNWEATYFDFNEEKILSIAKGGKELGVEMFVLDDGWFGKRNNDHSSLGDWKVNEEKLKGGLRSLSEKIHAQDMLFGLWFEPEMISPVSDLYTAHPDWCLHAEGRGRLEARWQLILDMSRVDVQDYIIEAVSNVLGSAQIDYVKWDMNRNFAEAGSALLADGHEGETAHRYMLGVYRVMDEIIRRFPHILFESCSGGGGRFDPAMLAYMPQTWTSDDTDAVERLRIQYGTSYVYPARTMGAHVSVVPNHQVGRVTPMKMRCEVA
ncbi:MAG: alpha-galactosidase, partial [Clostridia bacterium]|nr:alpha-galactosidase [Clostridia bacterium]